MLCFGTKTGGYKFFVYFLMFILPQSHSEQFLSGHLYSEDKVSSKIK